MDYNTKTLKELKIICNDNNIIYNKKLKKNEIIKLIIENTIDTIDTIDTITEVLEETVLEEESDEVSVSVSDIVSITAESVRENGLDKFYTIPVIAEKCINSVGLKYDWKKWDLVVEPSAGSGSFLLKIPTTKRIGIDISPEHKDIIKQDFLTYTPPLEFKNILVIGNPPFGKVSSLAVKFFNYSAKWASVIAFIIPKTFRRVSIQNKLNKQFHLIFDEEIPIKPCSFNPPMMVKCCFQIWEKKDTLRDSVELSTKHNDWDFLPFGPIDDNNQPTPPIGADFAIRAYGGKCGDIVDDKDELKLLRPKSWHWIKEKNNKEKNNKEINNKEILIQRFKSLDYSLSRDTARQNSIGRGELVKLYKDSYN
jgi:hypothetical protein